MQGNGDGRHTDWKPVDRPTSRSIQVGLPTLHGGLRNCALVLPWPSATGNTQNVATNRVNQSGGRIFALKAKVNRYRTTVSKIILAGNVDWRTRADVEVIVDFYPPGGPRADLDNLEKVLWDALKCRRRRVPVGPDKYEFTESPGLFYDDYQVAIKTVRRMVNPLRTGKVDVWCRELP
jgi:hypothetical protein